MSEAQSTLATSDWLMDYVRPRFTVDLKLHVALVVGSMGVGKTTWVLSLLAKAEEDLLNNGIDDDEIVIVHTTGLPPSEAIRRLRESNADLKKVKYLYVFIDDAPAAEGLHSRRAAVQANVEESKFVTMIRHRLSREGYRHFVFIPFSTQVYTLVDPTVRRTSKLKIIKDYPEEPMDLKTIGPMLGREYMAALRDISRKIFAPKNREELIEGLGSAVVRFLGRKRVVSLRQRKPRNVLFFTKEEDFSENNADSRMINDETINYMRRKLRKLRKQGRIIYSAGMAWIKHDGGRLALGKKEHVQAFIGES